MPLFALANAGIHVTGGLLRRRGRLADHARHPPRLRGRQAGRHRRRARGWRRGRRCTARARRSAGRSLAGGGAFAGHRLHGLAADLEPRLPRRSASTRRSSACSPRRSSRRCVAGSSSASIRRLPSATCARARSAAPRRTSSTSPTTSTRPATTSAGPTDAPVTLVEYGDFECPYCGQAEQVVRELLAAFGDDVRYVWRHLPLNDVHPQRAAGRRGGRGGRRAGPLLGDVRRAARPPGRR